jgi:hypothetical protein
VYSIIVFILIPATSVFYSPLRGQLYIFFFKTTLSGEFLKHCKPFVEEGVHPRVIIRAFRKATNLVKNEQVLKLIS